MEQFLSLGAVLRGAWRHYHSRFDVILMVNVLVSLPLYILLDWMTPRDLLNQSAATLPELFSIITQPAYLRYLSMQAFTTLCSVYVTIVIIIMLQYTYRKTQTSMAAIFQESLQYLPRAIAAVVLISILTGIGFLGLIIPGLVIALFLSFTIPALVWHNLPILTALKRSWQLVRKNWWLVFSYIVMAQFISSVISALVIVALPDMFGFTAIGLTVAAICNSYTVVFNVILFNVLEQSE